MNIYPRSGHVYLDLVEKEGAATTAQMRAMIWANDFPTLRKKFETVTGESFREGLKILFLARVNYHASYGFSLWISDLEPSYTLGELTRVKTLTIERLRREELFDLNRRLTIPLLPLRIAVISAETSKGYLDFLQVIRQHTPQFRFQIALFPALLQGDKAAASIRAQLLRILEPSSQKPDNLVSFQTDLSGIRYPASGFDLVLIVRGGGDEIGLTCFDDYGLARDICTFPLPVVTGIGHSTNETVVEMVASLNLITPTEVAYDLLGRLDHAFEFITDAEFRLESIIQTILSENRKQLSRYSDALNSITQSYVRGQRSNLEYLERMLQIHVKHLISSHTSKLVGMEEQVGHLDPKRILQRGYSLTYNRDGKILRDSTLVKKGDKIRTELAAGSIESTVD